MCSLIIALRALFCRLDCQSDLSASITKLNSKSKLLVVREAPQTVLVKLFKAWGISHLVFEKDTDAYARDRDTDVVRLAKEAGVQVITKVGRTLYDPDELVRANGGKPTMSITAVQHVRSAARTALVTVVFNRVRPARNLQTFHDRFPRRHIFPPQGILRFNSIRQRRPKNQT